MPNLPNKNVQDCSTSKMVTCEQTYDVASIAWCAAKAKTLRLHGKHIRYLCGDHSALYLSTMDTSLEHIYRILHVNHTPLLCKGPALAAPSPRRPGSAVNNASSWVCETAFHR